MIERDDLKAAIGSGLMTEQQAQALIGLALSRKESGDNLAPGDEPFELFRGFNEIFIIIGLFILATGWYTVVITALGDEIVELTRYAAIVTLVGAGVIWLLSEYFIGKRRMVGPASTLTIMFAANAAAGFLAVLTEPFMIARNDISSLPLPLALAMVALFGFWWRFRVPFAMAMMAIGLFVVTLVFAASQGGEVREFRDLFLLSAGGPFAWITLALGLLVFAGAMMFDMSDPHRVTRRSVNGFWLHVVAAPALVNTLALTLLDSGTFAANVLLLAVLTLFALVAIVIDRRSFLIAAIGYIVTMAVTVLDGDGAALTILILGIVLLLLGALWEKIRARVLRLLPNILPLDRLPPSYN